MHDHELLADLGEHADGSCPSTDGGAAAALARDRAAQDQLGAAVARGIQVSPGVAHAIGDAPDSSTSQWPSTTA